MKTGDTMQLHFDLLNAMDQSAKRHGQNSTSIFIAMFLNLHFSYHVDFIIETFKCSSLWFSVIESSSDRAYFRGKSPDLSEQPNSGIQYTQLEELAIILSYYWAQYCLPGKLQLTGPLLNSTPSFLSYDLESRVKET